MKSFLYNLFFETRGYFVYIFLHFFFLTWVYINALVYSLVERVNSPLTDPRTLYLYIYI